ncbi:MAG: TRAP transporter large permease subunit [Clostridia bacterium]|nr:TRAP transporter large permease subunit [Clostridia bacterium]
MIPSALIYLAVMLVFIIGWFVLLKRPVYEALFLSFILLVLLTGTWSNILVYIDGALATSLLYSMIVFVAMSQLLTHTKVIDSCIYLILALFGRITGGAGYASIIASSFMGALSGSGPGNVMSTGVITIPAMKKSGFPAELAANVESTASYLGNMIPPSSNIVGAFGAFTAYCASIGQENTVTSGQFWVILWGIAIYFILQRMIMLWGFCKYYKVKPMAKEDIPGLRETFRVGWKGLLLPVIILLPFVFDSLFSATFITARLGAAGASAFSKSLLLFIAGIAAIYTIAIAKDRHAVSPVSIVRLFASKSKSLVGPIVACTFGYMIGELFADIGATAELEVFLNKLDLPLVWLAFLIPLITAFLGMIIPGSSQVVIFGPVFISVFAAAGADPLFVAAMLPCICGTMCGITPPLALGMYAGMSIAESDFKKTLVNDLWWVAGQYALEVVMMLGILPVIGL